MSEARFEIEEDNAGEYRFKLIAPNNETIAVSEGYTTMASCKEGVEAVKEHAPNAKVVEE